MTRPSLLMLVREAEGARSPLQAPAVRMIRLAAAAARLEVGVDAARRRVGSAVDKPRPA